MTAVDPFVGRSANDAPLPGCAERIGGTNQEVRTMHRIMNKNPDFRAARPAVFRSRLIGLAVAAGFAVVASAIAVPTPALAVVAAESVSTTVRYTDLNLASAEGAKALETRMVQAAKRLCAKREALTAAGHRDSRRCFV